jgi:hypothetical protein
MSAGYTEFAFVTYNTNDYFRNPHEPDELALYRQTEEFICSDVLGDLPEDYPVIVAAQELPHPRRTPDGLQQLAQATGMQYMVDGRAALAAGGHDDLAVGLLWRGVDVVSDSWRSIEGGPLWHALGRATFAIGGWRVSAAAYHAPPKRGRPQRLAEASIVVEAMTQPDELLPPLTRNPDGKVLSVIGYNGNSVGADRHPDGRYYDPDPHQEPPAHYEGEPHETWYPTDRRPAAVMTAGGLIDVAPMLEDQWIPTTGHWPTEQNGSRRIDVMRMTPDLLGYAAMYKVIDTPLGRTVSNHLPARTIVRLPHAGS